MITHKDLKLGAIAGFLIGVLAYPVLKNLSLNATLGFGGYFFLALPFVFALLTAVGLLSAGFLSRFFSPLVQIAKFVVVGVLNTLVDGGLANLLIFMTGIAGGWIFFGFKSLSFIAGSTNSYFWNRFWTFESGNKNIKEAANFFTVSVIGLLFNVGGAALVINFIHLRVSPAQLANLGILAGTILGLVWNFLGYKFLVFKR